MSNIDREIEGIGGYPQGLTRRQFSTLLAANLVGIAALPLIGCARPVRSQRLNGVAEYLSLEEVVGYYNRIVSSPVQQDFRIITSTVKVALEYYGMDAMTSSQRAHNVAIEDLSVTRGDTSAGFVTIMPEGLSMFLDDDNFDTRKNPYNRPSWKELLHLVAHESIHMSGYPVGNKAIEDYGPLGRILTAEERTGFDVLGEDRSSFIDLINIKSGKEKALPNILEELAGEVGRVKFVRFLGGRGLRSEYTDSVYTSKLKCRCHSFLEPLLQNIYDPTTQKIFGSVLTPDQIMDYHNRGQRGQMYLELGQEVISQNPQRGSFSLPEGTTRAVGLLALSAFAYETKPGSPNTFEILRTERLDNPLVLSLADKHMKFLKQG